jgi:hypothetical protein
MVSEVDVRRYRQAFVTAVKKDFTNDDEVITLYGNIGKGMFIHAYNVRVTQTY